MNEDSRFNPLDDQQKLLARRQDRTVRSWASGNYGLSVVKGSTTEQIDRHQTFSIRW
ncbi:hypothetical protein [Novosphingobium sp. AP12]|uniref:hypothetical protein n=1 Tax=Novosphingobium sp. AP12 TaxID=1144305 RepID=UPI0012FB17F3|nr:hypothetical protein [Novosphingobium sp. AP12]